MIALRSRLSRTSSTLINRETWSFGTKSRTFSAAEAASDRHSRASAAHSPSLNQTRRDLNSDYSDRLLADIIEDGWGLVVSHGNGPPGRLHPPSRSVETIAKDEVDTIPVDYAVADTQGAIGYRRLFRSRRLRTSLPCSGLSRPVVALVTQSVVSLDDPAFAEPDETHRALPEPGAQARSMAP